jgi:Asp-tRNA(Asn)/Glu-tRNA(Gln) amidotransferase A subunit family amidase
MDFKTTSVASLAAMVRSRELSARDLTSHALAQIDALDGTINAFVCTDPDAAMAAASALDEALAGGLDSSTLTLAGIPLGVKDLEHAKGLPTTMGSALHANVAPAEADSSTVAALRAAGCIVVGKTNTPEDGHTADTVNSVSGRTLNPLDHARSPGGSSGGSAAALAAGMIPLATGSDGGGSIRIPSALCGLSGFKPTNGVVAAGPNPPGSSLLSSRGPMALSTTDIALALSVIVDGDTDIDPFASPTIDCGSLATLRPADPTGFVSSRSPDLPPRALRVAWVVNGASDIDDEISRVTADAVATLAAAGVDVSERRSLFDHDRTMDWWTLWTAALANQHGHLLGTPQWDLLWPDVQSMVSWGMDRITAADVTGALDACWHANNDITATLGDADVLVLPTVAGQTPFAGNFGTINGVESPTWVRFTYPFNMTRHPAGTVVAGRTSDGMPVGLQVVGRHHHDVDVLSIMAMFEQVLA